MSRKLLALLPVCLIFSACTGEQPLPEPTGEKKYVDVQLSDISTKDGNIFHAFCWKFSDVTANLASIAEQGFKSVQISPVQQPKSGGPNWWSFYQPLSFSIADNSTLGTKDDLIEMCAAADRYGISIIADIVFNHLANIDEKHLEADGTPTVSPSVEAYEPEIYAKRNASGEEATFHHNTKATGSGAITQNYPYGALPDLNTAHPLVQQRSLDLLKECIDVGIDGFRLDAAKHIETPTDPEYASDFFPNVIDAAKAYYKTKTNKTDEDLYVYGEILDDVQGGRTIDDYLPYMDVTDNQTRDAYIRSTVSKDCSLTVTAKYEKNCDPSHIVVWGESHDDYCNAGTVPAAVQVNRVWAMMMARKGAKGLYLARQANRDNLTVAQVGSYTFEEPSVAIMNKFHYCYKDVDDFVSSQQEIYICERYDEEFTNSHAAVIVDTTKNVVAGGKDVTFKKISDGKYYDQMTGKEVVVRGHRAHIDFGDSNICVLTTTENMARPFVKVSNRGGSFVDSLKVTVNLQDATGTYQINNKAAVDLSATTEITIRASDAVDGVITLKLAYGNEQYSYQREFKYRSVTLIEGYFNVINLNSRYFTENEIYLWSWGVSKGQWSKNYTVRDGVLLIDLNTFTDTSFLIALFEKGYEITNLTKWDENSLKQSKDLAIKDKFFDATGF